MIKLSDYVMRFLAEKEVKAVFMLPGGGCMHLVDSLGRNENIEYICCLHEQAVAVAAEAYGQHTNHLGVGLVTTGPGGANTVTGVTAAWIDSTPCLFLSGQVKRADLKGDTGVRQMGNQEADIVSIVRPITKYAAMVMQPEEIRYHLERAYHLATSGRKGPVWLDIPLDVQAALIDEESLPGFVMEQEAAKDAFSDEVRKMIELINQSERPVILAGNGIKLAEAADLFLEFAETANIPILLTWKMLDLLDDTYPLFFGSPGIMGQRGANFILQNADLLLIFGSRLDSSLTAYNHVNFAPKAKKVMVDIDKSEIAKMNMDMALPVTADMYAFLQEACRQKENLRVKDRSRWIRYCRRGKDRYPVVLPEYYDEAAYVNSYAFIDTLCDLVTEKDVIVPESSGSAGEVTYQAWKVKKGQKMKNAAGLGSMGFGLPYAIGSCIANDRRRTILINGDGAFQLNIQELATLIGQNLPVKIFIWNNSGYGSIMATQRNYFAGYYVASNHASKLFLPDIPKVARAYGLPTFRIEKNSQLRDIIPKVLLNDGPVLCEVNVSPFQPTAPRVQAMKLSDGTMISKPLEDMWPYLSEKEKHESMVLRGEKDERLWG